MLTALLVLLRSIGLICCGHRAVALENLALRQQLAELTRTVKRPELRTRDRLFWIALSKGWREWRTALIVVQPDTVVRWHRQWLRRQVGAASRPSRPWRPHTDVVVRRLVATMAATNPLWGAPESMANCASWASRCPSDGVALLGRRRRPPSQTWRTFLTNHVTTLTSMNFFMVPTLTGGVLFVLVLLTHQRRRIIHVNITEHPTTGWTAQQMIEAFPEDTAPRWLLRDRDAIHGEGFQPRVASMGIGPTSPWQNPYAERLIGSIRRECLDHAIVLGERHLRVLLTTYLTYYHGARTPLALEKDAPTPRRV